MLEIIQCNESFLCWWCCTVSIAAFRVVDLLLITRLKLVHPDVVQLNTVTGQLQLEFGYGYRTQFTLGFVNSHCNNEFVYFLSSIFMSDPYYWYVVALLFFHDFVAVQLYPLQRRFC